MLRMTLKLRVPRRPIRALQRPLTPVPEERTQLEPFLPTAVNMDRPLVAQVDVFLDC